MFDVMATGRVCQGSCRSSDIIVHYMEQLINSAAAEFQKNPLLYLLILSAFYGFRREFGSKKSKTKPTRGPIPVIKRKRL